MYYLMKMLNEFKMNGNFMKIINLLLLAAIFPISVFSQQNIDSLKKMLHKPEDTVFINCLNKISVAYNELENYDSAKHFANLALIKSKESDYQRGLKNALLNLGDIYYNMDDYENGIKNYLECAEIQGSSDNKHQACYCYNVAGILYRKWTKYDKSMEYHLKSLKLAEEINDKERISAASYGLARTYQTLKDYPKAIEYYTRSMKIDEELGDKTGMAKSFNNIGTIYSEKRDFDNAVQYYNKSLKLYTEMNDDEGKSLIFHNLGIIHLKSNRLQKAIYYLLQAKEIDEKISGKDDLAQTYISIADVYTRMEEYPMAYQYLENAGQLASQSETRKTLFESYTGLFEKQGDYKNALLNFKKFSAEKDSIYKESSIRQIAEMRTKYETEKKEQEIILLSKDQEIKTEELKRRRQLNITALSGLFVTLILLFFVYRNFRTKKKLAAILQKQKLEIEQQSESLAEAYNLIDLKNKKITDSLIYAEYIQEAILPPNLMIDSYFNDAFVLYLPKDVVSGDFYWVKNINGQIYIAVADCTGHGVPGALMSMLGVSFLNEITTSKNIHSPEIILEEMRKQVKNIFNQETGNKMHGDSIEIAICAIDIHEKILYYAGANIPVMFMCSGQPSMLEPDYQPAGIHVNENPFTLKKINYAPGDCIYLFTDGFADQFGGKNGKKFMTKRLKEMIISNFTLPMKEQKELLLQELMQWKGNREQIDDITVLGIRMI